MSYIPQNNEPKISIKDGPNVDSFSRLRISNSRNIFNTKLVYSNKPEVWDEQEVSGSGTSSSYYQNRASVIMSTGNLTAGKRVRQTLFRPEYQPGKSQLILLTGILGGNEIGTIRELGQHDDKNGIFFRNASGTYSVCKKSYVTGSAVDTVIDQVDWNLDKMDGTGSSGITVDFTKTHIFIIDYQWLGVGRIRFGLDIDGTIYYIHEMLHANVEEAVYMSTPNNPIRYSIENDGTGPVTNFECICVSVMSEGSEDNDGEDYWFSTRGVHVDADVANTVYAIIGIRHQTGYVGGLTKIKKVSVLSETNDDFEWILYRNPTISGTFTYSDTDNGPFQVALGTTANVVTEATSAEIIGDFGSGNSKTSTEVNYANGFGETIDGTRDEFVLCVRPLTGAADIQGGLVITVNH